MRELERRERGRAKKSSSFGFSLIELMVVTVIVGILAAVAVPVMSAMRSRAISSEALAAMGVVETACENYYVEHGQKANQFSELSDAGMVELIDLGGTYFNSSDIEGMIGVGKLPIGERGLGAGSGEAKGIKVTKAADGTFSVSGTYTP